jgi:hypothetical protein
LPHCIEHKGRTLHLLKAKSKPVPQDRGRRKVDLLGSFDQFQLQQEEHKHEDMGNPNAMPQFVQQNQSLSGMGGDPNMHVPNIIGNDDVSDMQSEASAMPLPDSDGEFGEGSQFKDITAQVMRTKRNRHSKHQM